MMLLAISIINHSFKYIDLNIDETYMNQGHMRPHGRHRKELEDFFFFHINLLIHTMAILELCIIMEDNERN